MAITRGLDLSAISYVDGPPRNAGDASPTAIRSLSKENSEFRVYGVNGEAFEIVPQTGGDTLITSRRGSGSLRGFNFNPGFFDGGSAGITFTGAGTGTLLFGAAGSSLLALGGGKDAVVGWNLDATDKSLSFLGTATGGQPRLTFFVLSELTSVANGVTTQASTIAIPTNAVVFGVATGVNIQPGGTTSYRVNGTASGTQFSTSLTVSTVAGTSDSGTKNCPFYDAQVNETITYTFNAVTTNALGRMRTNIFYYTVVVETP